MPTTRTSQNIDAVNFKEQSVDPAAPGAGYGHIFRTASGWQERVAANASSLLMAGAFPCDGRLTLTSGTPVTTANVTAATNIYFTPYKGNRIAIYDGTRWRLYNFTEKTLALGTITSGLPYDVFIYDNSGTLTLELLAWTNGTTRATALTTQDGVYVKSGATTRRYLGTFYTTSTTTTEDSDSNRFLWNYYNRVGRFLKCADKTNSWTYSTATWRPTNNVTITGTTRVECVIGVSEDMVIADVVGLAQNSGGTVLTGVGVGIDSTTVNNAPVWVGAGALNIICAQQAKFKNYVAVGYHYIQQLEIAQATGTTTWFGDNGTALIQTGMVVEVLA